MVSMPKFAAARTEEAGERFVRTVAGVPHERENWKPLGIGRSILDQTVECVWVNRIWALAFTDRAAPVIDLSEFESLRRRVHALHEALSDLRSSLAELIPTIANFPIDLLEADVLLSPSDETLGTFAKALMIPHWNMTYHQGQIAYVQVLYGDRTAAHL